MPPPIPAPAGAAAGARRRIAAAGLAALAAAPAAAPAQPAPEATLPPITVTAAPVQPRLTVPDNETRAEEFRRVPGNVTVVPATEFRDRPAVTTLRQALEYTPGVFAEPKWGEDSRLSIRGSGLARNFHLRGVRLYQDGVPINQADGSGDFQELDPLAAYRFEVLRGANAFPLGANTLGGAINLVSPTGRLAPGALLRAEAGSWGFFRAQAAYGAATERADAWIGGTRLTQEGYRDHSAGRSWRLNGNAAARWGGGVAETRVFLAYNDVFQQIPGAVARQAALRNPRAAAAVNEALNYQRNIRSTRVGTITALRPRDGVLIEVGGGFVARELDHPIFQYIDQRSHDANLFVRGTVEGSLAGLPSRTVAGLNLAHGNTRSRRFVNLGGVAGAPTAASQDAARTSDVFVESSLTVLPDFALIAGAQLGEAWRRSRDEFLADGDQSGSGRWRWVNPRLGLLWDAAPGSQVFGNLSWSTEPPTLSDLVPLVPQGGFSRLKPQRAYTLEVGTRGARGDLEWDVALYRAWLRDEIQLFTQGAGTSFALNAGRTIHQGVEAALFWTLLRDGIAPGDAVSLRQAYTYSDFRFDGDPAFGDNELPGAPRHLYRAELRYRHPSGAWVAPTLDWVPTGFYVDNANTLRTNSYALFGLRGGWNFANGLSAFFEARNLGDRRTIASASVAPRAVPTSALFEPGFGRSVFAGLQFAF
jgi:iron complex outermembrane recepter protein